MMTQEIKNCGIYTIINLINNKIYIGSSCNLKKRKGSHIRLLNKGKHFNSYLQRSWNKYGKDSFNFEIVHICDRSKLLDREQYCLDIFKPEYNWATNTKAPMLGKTHTNEFKTFISNIHKGNTYNLGRKHTKAERELRSKIRKKHRWSDEVKNKMSDTAKRVNSIGRIDRTEQMKTVYDNRGNIFKSLVEAGKFWNRSTQTVCDILKGRHKQTREGVIFYYEKS